MSTWTRADIQFTKMRQVRLDGVVRIPLDVARYSEMISPTNSGMMSPG
ncbi:hypothetical protein QA641_37490 [Bradyrhizobium sp. CB1650]|nr:hypothetical protein [Bradyrhizobium sp. CB1650]WGD51145.1 hypothetical protein QA641_37490 [Bradyrhizobium sp. CB1650]